MIPYSFRIGEPLFKRLMAHLFHGDNDEHGAVITAGVSRSPRRIDLLAREVILAEDGVDYVPGRTGYRAYRRLCLSGVQPLVRTGGDRHPGGSS